MRTILLVIAMLAGLVAPSFAAAKTLAPPGTSGVDEYLETVPDAKGERPGGSKGNGATRLPATARRALEAAGPDGRRVANLAGATAPRTPPPPPPPSSRTAAAKKARPTEPQRSTAGGSPLRTGLKVLAGGGGAGGIGLLLPIVLVITAFGAVTVALRRHRNA